MAVSSPTDSLLGDASLTGLTARLRPGGGPLRDYIGALCDRVQAIEPRLRSLLPEPGRRDRLLGEAMAAEQRWPDVGARPLLFGVPVGIKDIIAVEGMPTRAGSSVPAESFAMAEGTAVRQLRAAGALVLGKTVTTEFAYFDPGATVNPHAPEHTPGGSSSGSAAAVAAGIAPLALGSQTVGSVIRPAAFCGVVGVKPSHGRIPLDGVLAYSVAVDTLGFFTQDVAGARVAASVLVPGWRAVDAHALPLPTIGVPEGPYLEQAEPAALVAFDEQLRCLAAAGYVVRLIPALGDVDAISTRHRAVTTAEFAEVHRERFQQFGSLFRPNSAMQMDRARQITDAERADGLAGRSALRDALQALMSEHALDIWASPAAIGPAPLGLTTTGNPAMNLPWTHAGMPAVTLPAGTVDDGRPLGLQLTSRFGADEELLAWSQPIATALTGAASRPR